jgi:RNA polymerase sigma-70 factor, ECF subfamily
MLHKKSDHTPLTDEELMRRLINKDDQEALSELYKRYSPKLLGYFIKIFKGDVPKAQDFLQDVFVRILEKKHLFDPDRRFYTWVFTIASNMCKMSFREELTRSLEDVDSDRLILPDIDFNDQKLFKAQLKEAIYALEYNHRSVFILRYNEGFSLKDIAEITEAELGTVKSRLFYATKKMAEKLAEYNPMQAQIPVNKNN